MKRKIIVSASDAGIFGSRTVKITVEATSDCLTRDEMETFVQHYASHAMRAIECSPYMGVPLSRIKVS